MERIIKDKKIRMISYIVGIVWIAAMTQLFVNHIFMKEEKIMEAFAATEISMLESNLEVTANYGNYFMTEEDKKQMLVHIASQIGLTKDYTWDVENEVDRSSVTLRKEGKNANSQIKLISCYFSEDKNNLTQFIRIKLSLKEKLDSILQYKKELEDILEKLGVEDSQFYLSFRGTYKGQLTEEECKTEVDKLLNTLQGKIISQGIVEGNYTTYAYTNLVKDYLTVEDKRVNLNIAFSYDEEENRTNLYIGTPIYNQDY